VREWGDMIWAYMGPADAMPELPALEMALLPASHRYVSKKWQDCNWVQALEGSIDTAHFTFAHLSFEKEENEILDIKKHFVNQLARMSSDHMRWIAEDPRPVIKINPHDAGLTIAGGRLTGSDNIYWRIAQFLMPVHSYAPSAMPGENIFGQGFVPVTDTNCWIYTYAWNPERPITQAERDAYSLSHLPRLPKELSSGMTIRDRFSNYRLRRNGRLKYEHIRETFWPGRRRRDFGSGRREAERQGGPCLNA